MDGIWCPKPESFFSFSGGYVSPRALAEPVSPPFFRFFILTSVSFS